MKVDPAKPLLAFLEHYSRFIYGYDKELLACTCAIATFKTKNPCNVLLIGQSSAGKSAILKEVSTVFDVATATDVGPDEDVSEIYSRCNGLEFTGLSKKSLIHLADGFDWAHKILSIAELDGCEADVSLRLLASEDSGFSAIVNSDKKDKAKVDLFRFKNRPTIMATTASDTIEHQFANRCFMIEVHPTSLSEVHRKIAQRYIGEIDRKESTIALRTYINKLKTVDDVYIPFAEELSQAWDHDQPRTNRTVQDMFRIIQGSAIIHGRKAANEFDYAIARQVFCASRFKLSAAEMKVVNTLRTQTPDEFNVAQQKLVKGFLFEDLCEVCNTEQRTMRERISGLVSKGAMIMHKNWKYDPGVDRPMKMPFVYSLADSAASLPTCEQLFKKEVKTYLDGVI